MTYFIPVHSKTEYKLSILLRSYVGTIGNKKLLTEISLSKIRLYMDIYLHVKFRKKKSSEGIQLLGIPTKPNLTEIY